MPYTPEQLDDEPEQLTSRLTSRLAKAMMNATRGALQCYVKDHGPSIAGDYVNSAAKRVSKALWGVLKTHPDCRTIIGKFPDEIAAKLVRAEAELEKRSQMIKDLRMKLSDATGEEQ